MKTENRRDVYRLLGGLLDDAPSDPLCSALVTDQSLSRLGAVVGRRLGEHLERMHEVLARGDEEWQALRQDHLRLFVGPRKKLAAPWESVYVNTGRLVLQASEQAVVRAYAAECVGFEGMGQQPADHIALELQFCAVLIDRGGDPTALRSFLDHHLLAWVPAFAADVQRFAQADFHRALAGALLALCELESVAAAPVADAAGRSQAASVTA